MLLRRALKLKVKTLVSRRVAAPTPGVPSIPMSYVDKPGKFGGGSDFKRWQQKMIFYLTALNLFGCLIEEAPIIAENEIDN